MNFGLRVGSAPDRRARQPAKPIVVPTVGRQACSRARLGVLLASFARAAGGQRRCCPISEGGSDNGTSGLSQD